MSRKLTMLFSLQKVKKMINQKVILRILYVSESLDLWKIT